MHDEDDPEIEYSPLCEEVTRDGLTVRVQIYRLKNGDSGWSLEVIDQEGASTISGNAATLAVITILPPANVLRNASFKTRMRLACSAVAISIASSCMKRSPLSILPPFVLPRVPRQLFWQFHVGRPGTGIGKASNEA